MKFTRNCTEWHLEQREEAIRNRIGKVYGDYEVTAVEYVQNGDREVQEWTLRCRTCGYTRTTRNGKEYASGKAKGVCPVCKKATVKPKVESERTIEQRRIREQAPLWIGTQKNGYEAVELRPHNWIRVRCLKCGREKNVPASKYDSGDFLPCNHPQEYGEEYIGRHVWNLTVLEKSGTYFRCRCDCGRETMVRGVNLFRNGDVKTCGNADCPYHIELEKKVEKQKNGYKFEKYVKKVIEEAGYEVEHTPLRGDFGVDLIMSHNGRRMAIQCKNFKKPVSVKAVMEVYAGGAYYGCDEYCVFAPNGFTPAAEEMASVLGVQLGTDGIHMNYAPESAPRAIYNLPKPNETRKTKWEIDGIVKTADDWCKEYGVCRGTVMNRVKHYGISIKEALEQGTTGRRRCTAFGETKSLDEFSEEYGVGKETIKYRMENMGMTLEQALTAKKVRPGRPSKATA